MRCRRLPRCLGAPYEAMLALPREEYGFDVQGRSREERAPPLAQTALTGWRTSVPKCDGLCGLV